MADAVPAAADAVPAPAGAVPAAAARAKPAGTAVARRPGAVPAPLAEDGRWADLSDEEWDEIPLRTSLADQAAVDLPGSWRVGVTSAFPYSGTTTLVGILGLVLAGARRQPVLAVDLRPSRWPAEDPDEPRGDALCPRVGLPGDVTLADVARRRGEPPGTLRQLIGGQPDDAAPARPGAAELDVLPLSRGDATAPAGSTAVVPADDLVTPGMLHSALGHLTRAYPLVLVDAPVDAPLSPAALRASDLVVVVSLAAPADLDRTAAALRDPAAPLLPVDREGRRPPVIVAVVSPRRGRWSPRTRAAAGRVARHASAVVQIPYESRLDPSKLAPVRIPRLRGGTRRAYLRLGVSVVDALLRLAKEETARAAVRPAAKTPATQDGTAEGSTPETPQTPVI
jgi:hypothetical protein